MVYYPCRGPEGVRGVCGPELREPSEGGREPSEGLTQSRGP